MSNASSVLPSDLVSVEVAALQVGAHPQTSLTRCTFPVLYPVLAPERGPEWQTHAQRRNLGRVLRPQHSHIGDLVSHRNKSDREENARQSQLCSMPRVDPHRDQSGRVTLTTGQCGFTLATRDCRPEGWKA